MNIGQCPLYAESPGCTSEPTEGMTAAPMASGSAALCNAVQEAAHEARCDAARCGTARCEATHEAAREAQASASPVTSCSPPPRLTRALAAAGSAASQAWSTREAAEAAGGRQPASPWTPRLRQPAAAPDAPRAPKGSYFLPRRCYCSSSAATRPCRHSTVIGTTTCSRQAVRISLSSGMLDVRCGLSCTSGPRRFSDRSCS